MERFSVTAIKNQRSQEGAAAIEFALSLTLLLMICFGIVSYGVLFWTQQKISHLAADGARMALVASFQGDTNAASTACLQVTAQAQADILLNSMSHFQCLPDQSACPFDPAVSCATVRVSGTVEGWPLLEIMRGMARVFTTDPDSLLPKTLNASAIVQI